MASLTPSMITSLMENLKTGDGEALATLFSGTYKGVFFLAKTLVRNPEAAKKIMKEAYTYIAQSANAFDSNMDFNVWINKVVYQLGSQAAADGVEAVEEYESNDIMKVVEKMNLGQKASVLLKYHQGMSEKDIAKVIDEPLSAVKNYLQAAQDMIGG
ncbi:MAG: hypothetical protein HUJ57_05665 [Erysipelotrichaceae bacterium]|nr:hypothetical protein [Erysipelotrichaceae bacterium]